MKKQYDAMELEIVRRYAEDVITASQGDNYFHDSFDEFAGS